VQLAVKERRLCGFSADVNRDGSARRDRHDGLCGIVQQHTKPVQRLSFWLGETMEGVLHGPALEELRGSVCPVREYERLLSPLCGLDGFFVVKQIILLYFHYFS
jgi:hypothetical protein